MSCPLPAARSQLRAASFALASRPSAKRHRDDETGIYRVSMACKRLLIAGKL
jgi:hypothetical protein